MLKYHKRVSENMNTKVYALLITLFFVATSCFSMEKDEEEYVEKEENKQRTQIPTPQPSLNSFSLPPNSKKKIAQYLQQFFKEHPDAVYSGFQSDSSGVAHMFEYRPTKLRRVLQYILMHDEIPFACTTALTVLLGYWYLRHRLSHNLSLKDRDFFVLGLFGGTGLFFALSTSFLQKYYLHKNKETYFPRQAVSKQELAKKEEKRLDKIEKQKAYKERAQAYFTQQNLPLDASISYIDEKNHKFFLYFIQDLISCGILYFERTVVDDRTVPVLYTNSDKTAGFDASTITSIALGILNCTEIRCNKKNIASFVPSLYIETADLSKFPHLKKLCISHALDIDENISQLPNLKHLEITHSRSPITQILYHDPVPFKNLVKNIETLVLTYNNINGEGLFCVLNNLLTLKYLDFSHNRLATFPNKLFTCTALTLLNLSHNQLRYIPETVHVQVPKTCKYIDDPNTFGRLVNLTHLNLSHNKLKSLPEQITTLSNLTELDLSHNELTSLPDDTNRMSSLQVLDLTNNPIVTNPVLRFLSLPKGLKNQQNPRMTFDRTLPAIEEG